jgi:hypothetical protein
LSVGRDDVEVIEYGSERAIVDRLDQVVHRARVHEQRSLFARSGKHMFDDFLVGRDADANAEDRSFAR